jgi:anti-sigma regulatory factor (Ser/Thr protein kinase)
MHFEKHISFSIQERSEAAWIKREIREAAESIGFQGQALGEVEIIVSEIISNMLKHAAGLSEILVKEIRSGDIPGIEIIGIDNGPGMSELPKMMHDGVSTTHTLGQGLGAIKRLSHYFDIYTLIEWGTVILSRVYINNPTKSPKPGNPFKPGNADIQNQIREPEAVIVPLPGEKACGDAWMFKKKGNIYRILVMDGLGHGLEAQKAVNECKIIFKSNFSPTPSDALIAMHDQLRHTRGMVAAIVDYDPELKKILYCGIGNINLRQLTASSSKSYICYNGILGMNRPLIMHNRVIELTESCCIVLTSDGIKTKWNTLKYPGILSRDNSIIAAAIYKDNVRRTDDAIVVAFSINNL